MSIISILYSVEYNMMLMILSETYFFIQKINIKEMSYSPFFFFSWFTEIGDHVFTKMKEYIQKLKCHGSTIDLN